MNRTSKKLRPLEFAIYRQLVKTFAGESISLGAPTIRRVVVAVSGGADSLALLLALNSFRARTSFSLEVAHVHHGPAASLKQNRFRDRAVKKVEKIAAELQIPYVLLKAKTRDESEEACREARYHVLCKRARETGAQFIATGHHADDLFETRLIRLIRGTGPQGIPAMRALSIATIGGVRLCRPLLSFSRDEVRRYLTDLRRSKPHDWIDDPSNQDARYLRTQIRRRLLPEIESIRPGGSAAMARSLELIASEFGASEATDITLRVLDRAEILGLSLEQQCARLAKWLRAKQVRGISRAQIEEILKRIDTPRKSLSFTIGGQVWTIGREIHCVAEDQVDESARESEGFFNV